MGGAQMGELFDGYEDIETLFTTITEQDLRDVYHFSPDHTANVAEAAFQAGNPELAIFLSGILAARSSEGLINVGSFRHPDYRHPSSEYGREDYTRALARVTALFKVETTSTE